MAIDFLGFGDVVSDLTSTETPVGSAAISTVGYSFVTNELLVAFTDGSGYQYDDVPEETFKAFLSSGSKGRYFNQHIRSQFGFTRVA